MTEIRVTSLFVYPVKSCRGIELQEVACTPAGLALDRQWMVVSDAPDSRGKFLTQRQVPTLALVGVDVQPDTALRGGDPAAHSDAVLVLQSPAQPVELRVAIARPASQRTLLDVSCWGWSGRAEDEGELAASWLTAALGRPVRLVRFVGTLGVAGDPAADPLRRPCDPTWRQGPPGSEVRFQDAYPLLLASEASLSDLNARLGPAKGPLPMDRFRPNLVVSAPAAWAEDAWACLQVGGMRFSNVKPCDRCSVPRTNQARTGDLATAEVDPAEPTETLYAFRSGKALGWDVPKSFKHAVFLGVNLVPESSGLLKVGDLVRVLQRREGPYIPRAVVA